MKLLLTITVILITVNYTVERTIASENNSSVIDSDTAVVDNDSVLVYEDEYMDYGKKSKYRLNNSTIIKTVKLNDEVMEQLDRNKGIVGNIIPIYHNIIQSSYRLINALFFPYSKYNEVEYTTETVNDY